MRPFWVGFIKRADEDSDPYLDTFFRPDRSRPAWTPDWGVKINTDLDARDISEGTSLMDGQGSPEVGVLASRG